MDKQNPPHLITSINQFDGLADTYDEYRPKLPSVIVDVLTQLAGMPFPHCVADIGCGTGVSTRTWINRAQKVIGVEPNDDLRLKAESVSKYTSSITYQKGTATDTNLSNQSVDIVTICQALHWVEPIATFTEVSRILKPKGIFAAIDYDMPSMTTLEICELEKTFTERGDKLISKYNLYPNRKYWDKEQHLSRMEASGKFRNIQEFAVFSKEIGNVERIVGLNLSHGNTQILLKYGLSEKEIGLDTLRHALQKSLGDKSIPMYFTYRLRVGQKK